MHCTLQNAHTKRPGRLRNIAQFAQVKVERVAFWHAIRVDCASRSSLARPRASLSGVQNLGGSSSRPPARAPRTNRIWRACARPFPRQSMDMALAFCPPTEPFRAARRRAGPCGGHIAHGQALEGSVARYRSCHSVLIADVGSIRRVCHSNHALNQTAARPMKY